MTVSDDHFKDLNAGGRLPSPSGVALRLLELTRKDNASIDEIARAMQADPALSGRLIKFANSAVHGPRRPILSVFDALQRIGINTVRELVLGFSVLGENRSGKCRSFDYARFWSHSLASAIAANLLCLRVRVVAADEAFTFGLLSDVGSLALATLYPTEYAALLESHRGAAPIARAEAERRQFNVDHSELCAALLEDWKLPRFLITAIHHLDDPELCKAPPGSRDHGLVQMLVLARGLADYCVDSDSARKLYAPQLVLDAAKLGMDAETLSVVVDQIVSDWREWGRILEVKTQDVASFADPNAKGSEDGVVGRTTSTPDLEPLDILVVEDDPAVRMLLEVVLREQGHRLSAAENGHEALKLAIKHCPQLVISDWLMPGMDGVELCRTLRKTEQGQRVYFILLTSHTGDDRLIEAFEAGVDDYVTKPFNPRVVSARLRAAVRVVNMQRESERDSANLRKFATELAVANRRLQQAALTDSLTGLPNRRYLMERLEQEWAAFVRSHRTFSLMMVDIDCFKKVNDVHGHEVGDLVLRQVGNLMRECARTEDIVGRLGGEEFVVICPNTNLPSAMRLAERLRKSVASHAFANGKEVLNVTVSIGASESMPKLKHCDDVLRRADAALYRAKHNGRDCIEAARDSGEGSKELVH